MHNLAATKLDDQLGLVSLGQELADVLYLEVKVVFVGLGTKLHLLDLDHGALAALLTLLFGRFVFEATIVHDLADGRHSPGEWAALFSAVGVTLTLARYYVSPAAMLAWDQMNAEFGIGQRTLLSTLMGPKLRWLGIGPALTRNKLAARLGEMRARYADAWGAEGAG